VNYKIARKKKRQIFFFEGKQAFEKRAHACKVPKVRGNHSVYILWPMVEMFKINAIVLRRQEY
jgi:hypothetical protein